MKTEDAFASKLNVGDVIFARKCTTQWPIVFGVVKSISDEGKHICLERGYKPQLITVAGQQLPTLVERRDLDSFYLSDLRELYSGTQEVARCFRELDPRYEPYAAALEKSTRLTDR